MRAFRLQTLLCALKINAVGIKVRWQNCYNMLSSKLSLKGQGSLSCHVCKGEVGSFLKQHPVQKLLEGAGLQENRAVRQETLAEADHGMRLCKMKRCCSHCWSWLGLYTELRRAHCSESSSDFNYNSVNQSIKFPQKTNRKQKELGEMIKGMW